MASQESTASTISVPPEIIENQDSDFVSEINTVDSLYFSNAEVIHDSSVSDEGGESDTEENSVQQDPEADVNQEDLPLTGRREDDEEITSQYEFRLSGCGCSKIYGHSCSEELVWDKLLDYRQSCLEYTREELDLVLKVQMLGHRKNGDTTDSLKHKTKDRERSFQEYFLFGKQVCQKTFSFAHGVGYNKLRRVGSHLDSYGMEVRLHGNKGKNPKNALTVSEINNVILFLQSYANKNGLPLPGRLPNYRDSKVMLLPSDKPKTDIYQMYLTATSETGVRQVGQSTFYKLWSEHCPTLVIIKPATDLCTKCQNYSTKLSNGGNLSEEEKMEDLRLYNDHIQKAKIQRDYYRTKVEESKIQYTALPEDRKQRGIFLSLESLHLNHMKQNNFKS